MKHKNKTDKQLIKNVFELQTKNKNLKREVWLLNVTKGRNEQTISELKDKLENSELTKEMRKWKEKYDDIIFALLELVTDSEDYQE